MTVAALLNSDSLDVRMIITGKPEYFLESAGLVRSPYLVVERRDLRWWECRFGHPQDSRVRVT